MSFVKTVLADFLMWMPWTICRLECLVNLQWGGWVGWVCVFFMRPFMVGADGFMFVYFHLEFWGMNILLWFTVFWPDCGVFLSYVCWKFGVCFHLANFVFLFCMVGLSCILSICILYRNTRSCKFHAYSHICYFLEQAWRWLTCMRRNTSLEI